MKPTIALFKRVDLMAEPVDVGVVEIVVLDVDTLTHLIDRAVDRALALPSTVARVEVAARLVQELRDGAA